MPRKDTPVSNVSLASALAANYPPGDPGHEWVHAALKQAALFRFDQPAMQAAMQWTYDRDNGTWEETLQYAVPPYPVTLLEFPQQTVTFEDAEGLQPVPVKTGVLISGNTYLFAWQSGEIAGFHPMRVIVPGELLPEERELKYTEKDLAPIMVREARGLIYNFSRMPQAQDDTSEDPPGFVFMGASILGGPYIRLMDYEKARGMTKNTVGGVIEYVKQSAMMRTLGLLSWLNRERDVVEVQDRRARVDGKVQVLGQFVPRYYHKAVVLRPNASVPHRSEEARWPGPRRMLHKVRAHLRRLKDGRVLKIDAHWRGDQRLGIKTTDEYVVEGPVAVPNNRDTSHGKDTQRDYPHGSETTAQASPGESSGAQPG